MRKTSASRSRTRAPKPAAKAADAYHHGDLRHALIEAAYAHVDRDGPDSLSLAQLAKALGVSQPAPYRHFADRNALLAAVAAKGFREFTARLEEAIAAGPKAGALSRMGQAYVTFGTTRPGIYRLMFASPILRDAKSDEELQRVAYGSFELLMNALGGRDRQRRALQIWVALHGIVMLTNQGLMTGRVAPDVTLPELVDAVLAV